MTQAILPADVSRNALRKVALGGVLTGILTPLLPPLFDRIRIIPGDLGIALAALPFAVLVLVLVRRRSADPIWAAVVAAVITMIAFVCAVNIAIWIDGRADGAAKPVRNILSGLSGGFTGSAVMAIGIALLPAGPRTIALWWPMLITGTLAGSLFALDEALGAGLISVLYPVWQAAVAVQLAITLGRANLA